MSLENRNSLTKKWIQGIFPKISYFGLKLRTAVIWGHFWVKNLILIIFSNFRHFFPCIILFPNFSTFVHDKNLSAAEKQGVRKGLVTGFFMGYIWLVVFMCFAISFYVGADVFYYPAGQLITVFFCILMGSMYLGQAAPNLEAVSIAKTAARPVFDIIKRQSKIDATSDKGRILKDCKGDIQFHNVCFNYPLRPDIQILKNVNLKCNASEISAICGPSGMGKSTVRSKS